MSTTSNSNKPAPKTLDEYYDFAMNDFAKTRKGLLFKLPRGTPMGDLAFTNHRWTRDEAKAWEKDKAAPLKLEDLSSDARLITKTFHGPDGCMASESGIALSEAERERIKETPKAEMSIFITAEGKMYAIPRVVMNMVGM